jgi:uncharacterized protein
LETPGHLIVDIARLQPEGEIFSGETAAGLMDMGARAICEPVGGIAYQIHVEQIGQELLARGRVSLGFRCACSRCGESFALEVVETAFFADFEVTAGTEFVDLTPEMREAIMLALPGYPVCREDCKGLCARCGANRNRETCTCGPALDGSWAALDLLVKR